MYDPNCAMCKTIVYGPPVIVCVVVGVLATLYSNRPETWLVLAIALPLSLPIYLRAGKRMPMLHELVERAGRGSKL